MKKFWKHTIPLAREELIFKGSNWVEDPTAIDSPLPGRRYVGTISCFAVNDVFWWATSDAIKFNDKTCEEFEKCFAECGENYHTAALLYVCRREGLRPQGAYYTYIPKRYWHLFDACGPERGIDYGNPCKPGDYRPEEQVE